MQGPAESSGSAEQSHLTRLYARRFGPADLEFRRKAWDVLCRDVFQQYVAETGTVLDLGAGTCEFINAIRAAHKIAVDLNPEVERHAIDARVIVAPSTNLEPVETGSVNVVFCSNLLEHLPSKADVLVTLGECHRVLRPAGTLIVLQPNIRYLPGAYWDYFDHHTPLTHVSLVEALDLTGFRAERVIPRFLPYTVKDRRIPRSTGLLRAYLRLPFLWRLAGKQMLVVARRSDPSP